MFQTRLKELREAAGYKSQQAFADAFGVAQSTVGGWEAGKREPNYDVTIRLAQFFGVSVDSLINEGKGDAVMSGKPFTFFNKNGWPKDIAEDYENAQSDEVRVKILEECGYDEAHTYAAHQYFPWQFNEIKDPIPVPEDGIDPLDERLNELLPLASDETKRAMIVLLEQTQKQ